MVTMQDADNATSTAPGGTGSSSSSGTSGTVTLDGTDLLMFGGVVLLIFGVIYVIARLAPANGLTGASSFVTFARLYGLVTVAVLAVTIAFAAVADEARTAAFAVLGTIAGYLAGASATSTTTKQPGPDSQTTEVTQSGI